MKLKWEKRELSAIVQHENTFTINSECFKHNISSRDKIASLFWILFLTIIVLMIFPLYNSINLKDPFFTGLVGYMILISISLYLAWLFITIFNRYIKMKEQKPLKISLIQISDLILPTIGIGFWIAYTELSKLEVNPLFYLMEVTMSDLDLNYVSNLSILFAITCGIFFILSLPIIMIFNVWLNPPEKMKKLMKYGEKKSFKFDLISTKGLPIKIFGRMLYLSKPKDHYELKSIPLNMELMKCWRIIYPYYFPKVMVTVIFSSFLLSYGSLFCDLVIFYDWNLLSSDTSLIILFYTFVICALVFLIIPIIHLYNNLFKPIYDYFLLRKTLQKELSRKIDEIYDKKELNFEIQNLLYLQDCLIRLKTSPVLPFNLFSLLFLFIPFIGPIINIIFNL